MTANGSYETGRWAEYNQQEIENWRASDGSDCRSSGIRQAAEVAGNVIRMRLDAAIEFAKLQLAARTL